MFISKKLNLLKYKDNNNPVQASFENNTMLHEMVLCVN